MRRRRRRHPFRRYSVAGSAPPRIQGHATSFSASNYSILAEKDRLIPSIETEKPDDLLSKGEDHEIVAKTRDLHRNNSQIQSWINRILLHTIGTGQTPSFESKDKSWNKQASSAFANKSKNWDAKTGKHRVECDRDVLKTCLIEGEILVMFDHAGIINKGRFVYFQRDRMPEISDFKANIEAIAKEFGVKGKVNAKTGDTTYDIYQNKGVIETKFGVVLGYIIGGQVGDDDAKYENVTLISLKKFDAKLITMSSEVGGTHGHSALLACADDVKDVTKLRKSQVKKAAAQAKYGMMLKVKDSKMKSIGRSQSVDGLSSAKDVLKNGNEYNPNRRMTRMEKMGEDGNTYIEYIDPDEDIQPINMNHGDAVEVTTLSTNISLIAAYSLGLTRLYATGDASHGVFASLMAENNLAGVFFSYLQKWLERELYDWQAEVLMRYYMKRAIVKPVEDPIIKWTGYDKIESLNPLQAVKALIAGLESGVNIPDIEDLEQHLSKLTELRDAFIEKGINSSLPILKKEEVVEDAGSTTKEETK